MQAFQDAGASPPAVALFNAWGLRDIGIRFLQLGFCRTGFFLDCFEATLLLSQAVTEVGYPLACPIACSDCYNGLLLLTARRVGSRYNWPAWLHLVPSASVGEHSTSNSMLLLGHQCAIGTEQPAPSQSRNRTEFGQRPVDRSRITDRFGEGRCRRMTQAEIDEGQRS
jgi:hypothetical protein